MNAPVPYMVAELETIRRRVDALAASDKLDKESALQVTGLFHSMESLLCYECNIRDRRLLELKSSLELAQVKEELAHAARQCTHSQEHSLEALSNRKKTSRWS